jgi:ABC-type multidrug transport system fused ATPase/permease subunit
MQRYYIPTARELTRLSEIQRAPILHHFAESLTGAASIRAYGQKDRFSKANLSLCNNHSRPWFHSTSAIEWLCFRLNMLSNLVFAFSLTLLVSLPEGFVNPSKFCMHRSSPVFLAVLYSHHSFLVAAKLTYWYVQALLDLQWPMPWTSMDTCQV